MPKFLILLDAHIELESDAKTKEEAVAEFFEELSYEGELVKADYDIKEVK